MQNDLVMKFKKESMLFAVRMVVIPDLKWLEGVWSDFGGIVGTP